jgi:excisionase family DNA binding protein
MITILDRKYYTVSQAAELAGCTSSYVRRLLRANKVEGLKVGERAWILSEEEIEKLKESPTGRHGHHRRKKD